MTHDYKRNSTTTLFAAHSMLRAKVIKDCMYPHLHQEFIRPLKRINSETPSRLQFHLIIDNCYTRQKSREQPWLSQHLRFPLHLKTTYISWHNMTRTWLSELTKTNLLKRLSQYRQVAPCCCAISKNRIQRQRAEFIALDLKRTSRNLPNVRII